MPHGKKTAPSHLVLARGGLPGHCPNKRVTQLLSGITLQRENDPHIRTTTHQPKQPNVPTAAQCQPRAQTGPSCAGPVLPVPGWLPGVPPDPAMLVAVKECSPRRRLHPAPGQVPGRGCPRATLGWFRGSRMRHQPRRHNNNFFLSISQLFVSSAPRGFLGVRLSSCAGPWGAWHWWPGLGHSRGQPERKSCSVIIRAASCPRTAPGHSHRPSWECSLGCSATPSPTG